MTVHISEIDRTNPSAWENYVNQHPQGTFFHTLIWRDAVEEVFGHDSKYLAAWRNDRIVGVFPLMRIRSSITGTILVSIPYAVYGGTLADDQDTHQALLHHAQNLAERYRAQWIDIRCREQQWLELPVVKRYVTFRKTLPDDPEKVMSGLPRKARAAARHARNRYQLVASFDDDHLSTVWSLYSKSMRRLASLNYPSRFFELLIDRTSEPNTDHGKPGHLVQLVFHKNKPIAGLISFIYRHTLMPYFAGCDERFAKYHPNNFLYLTAMEEGIRLGCNVFDFGRSRIDNTGSYNFKRFQGFEPSPLHYQYYVPKGGRVPDLHPNNPRLSMARRVWPRLPLSVTRPLGAWLSKSVPG